MENYFVAPLHWLVAILILYRFRCLRVAIIRIRGNFHCNSKYCIVTVDAITASRSIRHNILKLFAIVHTLLWSTMLKYSHLRKRLNRWNMAREDLGLRLRSFGLARIEIWMPWKEMRNIRKHPILRKVDKQSIGYLPYGDHCTLSESTRAFPK